MSDEWQLFADDDHGRPMELESLLAWMQHMVEEHGADPKQIIDVFVDMIRPGTSDNSHDVKQMFIGSMYTRGFGEVADKFASLWLNIMPWGVGFAIAVEREFVFKALAPEAQRAIMESLALILRVGEMKAHVDENMRLVITGDDGDSKSFSVDEIVRQFRAEVDDELGPDAPDDEGDKSIRKWMP